MVLPVGLFAFILAAKNIVVCAVCSLAMPLGLSWKLPMRISSSVVIFVTVMAALSRAESWNWIYTEASFLLRRSKACMKTAQKL